MDSILAIILAGGRGERLSILAEERTKPAIPFAGKYRIIDFTLSNCVNSGIRNLALLTQYQPLSLIDHIGIGTPWDLDRPDHAVRVIQAYLGGNKRGWDKGTADAVYQNFQYVEDHDSDLVLILSGDHVCKMDYSGMIKFHKETQAEVTLAVTRLPKEDLERFGTIVINEAWQVTDFQEKVKHPKSNLASMGIYLFKKDVLQRWLEEDAGSITSRHDFGKNIFPKMVEKSKIFAYNFQGYWRDIGTIQTYWQSNMDMLELFPDFLSYTNWHVRTKEEERPPALVSKTGDILNSLISSGCIVTGRVEHSVLSPGVKVLEGAIVKDSIILSDSVIGTHSVVDHAILDKDVIVETGSYIGFGDDFQANRKNPKLLNAGITLIGKRARLPARIKIGRNCIIGCGTMESDFPSSSIESGETIKPKRKGSTR